MGKNREGARRRGRCGSEGERQALRRVARIRRARATRSPKGMPTAVAKEIAGRVSAWAVKRAAAADDPLLHSLAQIAGELTVAIDATEADRLDRLLIERMVEQAIEVGVSDPTAVAEAAPWRAVSHPGAVWGDAKSIVWWHFADVGESSSTTVWNVLERAALKEAGCPLDEPELELKRLASAWERPSRHARDRLLLIRPTQASGSETEAHPLWHALVAKRPGIVEEISVRAEDVLHDGAPAIAGRTLARMPVAAVAPPESPRNGRLPRQHPCPRIGVRHLIEDIAVLPVEMDPQIRGQGSDPACRQSLPKMDNLVGTLAHKIAQEIFLPGEPPEPMAVKPSQLEGSKNCCRRSPPHCCFPAQPGNSPRPSARFRKPLRNSHDSYVRRT